MPFIVVMYMYVFINKRSDRSACLPVRMSNSLIEHLSVLAFHRLNVFLYLSILLTD